MDARFCDDRGNAGFSWIVDESLSRTSHALVADGGVWLVDPVDWSPAVERAESSGRPAGVLQLLDRHGRDCVTLAGRLGVPHLVVPDAVPESPFELTVVKRSKRWAESALWWPDERTLVVAEAVGTNEFFPIGDDPLGVHAMLKLSPPRMLSVFEPEHLLVGHGEGLHAPAAAAALQRALARSRMSALPWLVRLPLRVRRGRRAEQR